MEADDGEVDVDLILSPRVFAERVQVLSTPTPKRFAVSEVCGFRGPWVPWGWVDDGEADVDLILLAEGVC